ncbi:hypothetical protein BDZ85DRAFT_284562 [Elsinoe ampelina]|uniref:Mid2 domain-containing protein n=1 Tax=Elsinoe ampelina TaxID=302913 RepID=A0A6A6G302_9PEZI|nr:hypothetical protein BDZ85DRAFT_284562 [Elsinoe ampelina]
MLRHLHLAVLLAFIAFAFAVDLPAGFLHPRQDTTVVSGVSSSEAVSPSTSAQPTTPPSTTVAPPTSASPTPQPTTSAAPSPTTTAAPPSSTTAAPPSSSAAPPSSSTPTTAAAPPSTSSIPPSSTITDTPSNTISAAPSDVTITSTNLAPLDQILTTITYTSDGRLISSISTSTRPSTSSSTSKPGLASGYGNETNTLSAESKKLIGGIVGGIGGAFLLAGIAFVVYKMWGKKRHQKVPQEEDYFGGAMSTGSSDSIGKEKKSGWGPSSLTNKFAEPLDRYKSSGGNVTSPVASSWGGRSPNAASNF